MRKLNKKSIFHTKFLVSASNINQKINYIVTKVTLFLLFTLKY